MDMGAPDPELPQGRLGQRVPVGQRRAEIVLLVPAKSCRKPPVEIRRPVVINDASATGASVFMAPEGGPPAPGQTFDLVLEGNRGTVRVRWVRHLTDDSDEGLSLLCGVEFTDRYPAFLPTICRWLEEEKTIDKVKMHD
jgi:hypothetical protein